jgi:phage shock protein E
MTELSSQLISEATIIDVRQADEVAEGMFEGAIHICLDDLPDKVDEIRTFETPLILYCRSGKRSEKACLFLEENGFSNVHNGINKEHLESF